MTNEPKVLQTSIRSPLTGAFFVDAIGQAGIADHVHDAICIQNTLTPLRLLTLGRTRRWLDVPAGSFRLWLPGDEQRRESFATSRQQLLVLRPAQFERIAHAPLTDTMALPARGENVPSAFVSSLFAAIGADIADGCPAGSLVGDGLVASLVNWLLTYKSEGTKARGAAISRRAFTRLTVFVDERLAEPLSIEDMATQVGLSPRHFSRSVKSITGLSPYQWLLSRRIERAADLLRRKQIDFAEVALVCGFADQSQMCKLFKRSHGTTPGVFHRLHVVE